MLVDADGVLLNWKQGFADYIESRGYMHSGNAEESYWLEDNYHNMTKKDADALVGNFNTSTAMKSLPPLRDAVHYINKLHVEHNYVFHCITSVGSAPETHTMRMENINSLFVDTAFERVVCLGLGEKKDKILAEYASAGLLWIEDSYPNALDGLKHGLKPLLMHHDYNANKHHPDIVRVNNWEEIYKIAIQNYATPSQLESVLV